MFSNIDARNLTSCSRFFGCPECRVLQQVAFGLRSPWIHALLSLCGVSPGATPPSCQLTPGVPSPGFSSPLAQAGSPPSPGSARLSVGSTSAALTFLLVLTELWSLPSRSFFCLNSASFDFHPAGSPTLRSHTSAGFLAQPVQGSHSGFSVTPRCFKSPPNVYYYGFFFLFIILPLFRYISPHWNVSLTRGDTPSVRFCTLSRLPRRCQTWWSHLINIYRMRGKLFPRPVGGSFVFIYLSCQTWSSQSALPRSPPNLKWSPHFQPSLSIALFLHFSIV